MVFKAGFGSGSIEQSDGSSALHLKRECLQSLCRCGEGNYLLARKDCPKTSGEDPDPVIFDLPDPVLF